MNLLRRWESGPIIPVFSLHRSIMRLKTGNIWPRSTTFSLRSPIIRQPPGGERGRTNQDTRENGPGDCPRMNDLPRKRGYRLDLSLALVKYGQYSPRASEKSGSVPRPLATLFILGQPPMSGLYGCRHRTVASSCACIGTAHISSLPRH